MIVIEVKSTSYLEGNDTKKIDKNQIFSENYSRFNLDIFKYFFLHVYRVVTTLLMHSIAWKTSVLL